MKIAVVCAPGIGDALILHIVSHHLALAGHSVTTVTPHRFGKWLPGYSFADETADCHAVFLQHDNSARAKEILKLDKPIYTFYGKHQVAKHGPLRTGLDFVCDPNRTMVENAVKALQSLFQIRATFENGLKPPPGLIHRRHRKRVAIHTTSGNAVKNWPLAKFERVAKWLESEGFEPAFLPQFGSLEDLASFIYESGYFLGNDSGPGHMASYFKIPHLIIGKEEKQMHLWRPGWSRGEVVVPPRWVPNWKGLRLRENHWKKFISVNNVINRFKKNVLCN